MGKVYLVGAGPGDPELITVKGLRCIQQADVILYDRLVNKELLDYAKLDVELINCGKLPNYHLLQQETINRFLVKYAHPSMIVIGEVVHLHNKINWFEATKEDALLVNGAF